MNKMFAAFFSIAASGVSCNSSTQTMLDNVLTIKSQKGVTIIEYALIAVLISIVTILLLSQTGTHVETLYTNIVNAIGSVD